MNNSYMLGALCAVVLSSVTMLSSAFAATADNVECDGCVNTADIAVKAVTSSRIKSGAITTWKIKNGAVTEKKLSGDVLDLIMQPAKRYVIVDINDQVIGGAIGDGEGGADPLIMSPQGYIATTSIFNGMVKGGTSAFFTGADCTGTAYVSVSVSGEVDIGGEQTAYFSRQMIGEVANLWGYDATDSQLDYWYVPKVPTLVSNFQMNSLKVYDRWGTGEVGCFAVSYMLTEGAEVFPNDPAITGIPNAAFSAPLRYDYR